MIAGSPRMGLAGPILPFRGGIAQHTTLLHRALSAQADLCTLSYTRLYPRWLFPGESDRDPAYAGHRESGVTYQLDTLNPLSWRRASQVLIAHRPIAVVIPWWTVFHVPSLGTLARYLRRAGIPVIFVCHNVLEHEAATWKRLAAGQVLKCGNAFVVHSRNDAENLRAGFPAAEIRRHLHPVYDHFPPVLERAERRAGLELLFYGFVRPYKGLDLLLQAVARTRRSDLYLSVVGEFWQGYDETRALITRLGIGERVEVVPRYVSEEETAAFFGRADLVVLPYRSATGTGVIPVAYHYGKPVLATEVGGLPDAVDAGQTGFLVPPNDPDALAQLLEALEPVALRAMGPAIERFRHQLSWDSMAALLVELAGAVT